MEHFLGSTRNDRCIRQTQINDTLRAVRRNDLTDHGAKPTERCVLLCRHNDPCLFGSHENCCCVQRLDAVHIQHRTGNSLFFQQLRRLKCRPYHLAASNNRCVASVAKTCCVIHFKWRVLFGINILYRIAPQADVCCLCIGEQRLKQLFCLEPVAWKIYTSVYPDTAHHQPRY